MRLHLKLKEDIISNFQRLKLCGSAKDENGENVPYL